VTSPNNTRPSLRTDDTPIERTKNAFLIKSCSHPLKTGHCLSGRPVKQYTEPNLIMSTVISFISSRSPSFFVLGSDEMWSQTELIATGTLLSIFEIYVEQQLKSNATVENHNGFKSNLVNALNIWTTRHTGTHFE